MVNHIQRSKNNLQHMKETIVRISTRPNGRQIGVKVFFLEMEEGGIQEFKFGEYDIEYFEENQLHLENGDYPESMFDQVVLMASVVAPDDPIPICNYRGLEVKKEFRKYKKNL